MEFPFGLKSWGLSTNFEVIKIAPIFAPTPDRATHSAERRLGRQPWTTAAGLIGAPDSIERTWICLDNPVTGSSRRFTKCFSARWCAGRELGYTVRTHCKIKKGETL